MTDLDWCKSAPASDITVQDSPAWRTWRGKGLGSSDAAVLLGWSPWKTADQLLQEKLGLWTPEFGSRQRSAMERGKELEPVIRRWYEKREGALFPDAIATDAEHEFMRASFDGINRDVARVIEIKAPNAKDHEAARMGFVTDKYLAQVQWLLMIARIGRCDYISYGANDTYAVVEVMACPETQKELRARALAFWAAVEAKASTIDFPLWSKPDVSIQLDLSTEETPLITEQETESLVAQTLIAQTEHVAAEARYKALKEQCKARLGDRKKAICGEAVLEWQDRKGSVDYEKIPALQGMNLEPYRKPGTRAFLFSRIEKKSQAND